jgi:TonB C terminal
LKHENYNSCGVTKTQSSTTGDDKLNRFSDYKRIHALALWGLLITATSAIGATADDENAAYLGQVEKRIMAAWKLPPKSDGLKVTLRYNLAGNGSVSFVRVEKSSGNQSFDDSAV